VELEARAVQDVDERGPLELAAHQPRQRRPEPVL
jgi:hypothetical protein